MDAPTQADRSMAVSTPVGKDGQLGRFFEFNLDLLSYSDADYDGNGQSV